MDLVSSSPLLLVAFVFQLFFSLNPLSFMSDQERISPYNISIMLSMEVRRIKKISLRGLLVDPILNSPN